MHWEKKILLIRKTIIRCGDNKAFLITFFFPSQSQDEVAYLRKTLAVEATEEEALQYFQNQFSEAYDGAWTTKIDWFFHYVKHRQTSLLNHSPHTFFLLPSNFPNPLYWPCDEEVCFTDNLTGKIFFFVILLPVFEAAMRRMSATPL